MAVAEPGRWAEIRRAYLAANEPVSILCRRFGISTGTLYRRARGENWPKRRQAKELAFVTSLPGSAGQDALVARLYEALRLQMTAIEKRLQAMPDLEETNATTIAERDARTLSTLVRTLEKLIELQGDVSNGAEKTKHAGAELDAERFRVELIRRIEEFGG